MRQSVFDFGKMALDELVQLRDEVETHLNKRIVGERQALQAKLDALTTLAHRGANGTHRSPKNRKADDTRRKGPKVRKPHPLAGRKAAPKYRGPNGETWSGRGLPPRWLAALEKKGKKREAYLI